MFQNIPFLIQLDWNLQFLALFHPLFPASSIRQITTPSPINHAALYQHLKHHRQLAPV
ncbi:hypothetical protein PtA15_4A753 [Puccinia triticina]|uniref:Uncharacterized protein n=1 Tax=Puccinia triticina TaxID=208348 RepID=A0ABY7CHR6_9BASI|nr:uncharacterized protein PtA15_4A753 [Puccinia triticina]WAQ84300.1 hypothetical protein PtA15_4A753 [Puccinia triticina]